MMKKLQTFNTIQKRVKNLFDDLVRETKAFTNLHERKGAIADDKVELQKKLEEVNDLYKKLQDELTEQVVDLTEDQLKGCNTSVEQLRDKIRDQSVTTRTVLRDFTVWSNTVEEQKAAQARIDAERAQKDFIRRPERPTFNKELKPKMVPNGSFTMAELRSWLEDFESYFKTNQIAETHGPKEQRIFLKNALEENLAKELFDKITDANAPVIGGVGSGSCLDALRQLLENKNPLEVRRYNFYKCNQKPHEKLSTWRVRLKNEGRECDLTDFTIEDHYYFRLLIGTQNQKFREELMKLSSKKDADIDKLIATLESRQTLEDALDEVDKLRVDAMSAYKKEQNRQKREKAQQRGEKANLCSHCGRGNCQGKDNREKCRAWGKDCKKCGKPNHFAAVCHTPENTSDEAKDDEKKVEAKARSINVRGLRVVLSDQNGLKSPEATTGEANEPMGPTLNGESRPSFPSVLEAESGDLLKEHLLALNRALKERVENMEYAHGMSSDHKNGLDSSDKVNDLTDPGSGENRSKITRFEN